MKRTLIVGATPNPSRYAFMAAEMLTDYGHKIVPVGIKKGMVCGEKILYIRDKPEIVNIDTITLYIGPPHQAEWYQYLIGLEPARIIFNPGTENEEFYQLAKNKNIEVLEACTLVMLRSGMY